MKKNRLLLVIISSFFVSGLFTSCFWMFFSGPDPIGGLHAELEIQNLSSFTLDIKQSYYDNGIVTADSTKVKILSNQEGWCRFLYYLDNENDLNGIVSFSFVIEIDDKEVYAACGWPESEGDANTGRIFNKFGLFYMYHPLSYDTIEYTEINGTKEKLKGKLKATVTDREDGGINVEWSAETSSLDL